MNTDNDKLRQLPSAPCQRDLDVSDYFNRLLAAEPDRLEEVARQLAVVPVAPDHCASLALRFDLLPLHDALALQVLPLMLEQVFCLVMAEPWSRDVRSRLQRSFGASCPRFAMSMPGTVENLLKKAEASERVRDEINVDAAADSLAQAVESISLASIAKDESPIIRLVNATLYDALQSRASDIHVEAVPEGMAIRYRIDGVMQLIRQIPGREIGVQTMSRLKVLSSLDIGEQRVPQDGRFKVALRGREIDFRVSVMPGIHGENAVLRVLDKSQRGEQLSLAALGIDAPTVQRIRALAMRPYGLVLVTGPTGSGKTTTLYATLAGMNSGDEKIITIEDPVEYELNGILQIPVNDKKGLTFARGLRSILRHDPDTILIGEIRDEETASIAVQSALTGHRVLSTVHANDAFSVVDRFIYMGVEPSSFLEALSGIVSQRLVRRICQHCGIQATLDEVVDPMSVVAGSGCDECRGTGFHGRIALAEVLALDSVMKAALLDRAPGKREQALQQCANYQSLQDSGRAAVRSRLTTLQEVRRAIAMD